MVPTDPVAVLLAQMRLRNLDKALLDMGAKPEDFTALSTEQKLRAYDSLIASMPTSLVR